MFKTNNSIRLVSKLNSYLELIQQCNNRYEEKRSLLACYDASGGKPFSIVRLMNERHKIVEFMERWMNLSNWLIIRYQKVFTELGTENLRQMRKELERVKPIEDNELQTIENFSL